MPIKTRADIYGMEVSELLREISMYRKLKSCKASSYTPEWRKRELEAPLPSAEAAEEQPKQKTKRSKKAKEAKPKDKAAPKSEKQAPQKSTSQPSSEPAPANNTRIHHPAILPWTRILSCPKSE